MSVRHVKELKEIIKGVTSHLYRDSETHKQKNKRKTLNLKNLHIYC